MQIELEFPSYRTAQGIWEHHIRQSDVNDYRQCPESFRQTRYGEVPKREGDAAIIGSSCHSAFQASLEGWVDDLGTAIEVAQDELTKLWPNAHRVMIKSEEHARESIAGIVQAFWYEVLESILAEEVIATERRFDVLANATPSRKLYLSGTQDVWTKASTKDFKCPGKDWSRDAWKVERYNVQGTLYSWARDQVELADDKAQARRFTLDYAWEDELYPFEFIVINRDTFQVYRQTVNRRVKDARFLHDEIQAMCDAIEYLPKTRWPKRPDDWHCSPKWCPAWSNCRGKYLGADPWKLMEKAERLTGVPAEQPARVTLDGLKQQMAEAADEVIDEALAVVAAGIRKVKPPADAT